MTSFWARRQVTSPFTNSISTVTESTGCFSNNRSNRITREPLFHPPPPNRHVWQMLLSVSLCLSVLHKARDNFPPRVASLWLLRYHRWRVWSAGALALFLSSSFFSLCVPSLDLHSPSPLRLCLLFIFSPFFSVLPSRPPRSAFPPLSNDHMHILKQANVWYRDTVCSSSRGCVCAL